MSESERRTSGLAIASLVLGGVGFLTFWILIGFFCALIGLILGIVAAVQISSNKDELSGMGVAIGGIVVNVLVLVAVPVIVSMLMVPSLPNMKYAAQKTQNLNNLQQLGKAIMQYSSETQYGVVPSSLDVLYDHGNGLAGDLRLFQCPLRRRSTDYRCDYLYVPGDRLDPKARRIVVVDKPGNLNDGVCAVFSDMHVRFIPVGGEPKQRKFVDALMAGDEKTVRKYLRAAKAD